MATTFDVTHDEKTYTVGIDGSVAQDGNTIGAWTTNEDSAIVVMPQAPALTLPFDFDAEQEPIATIPVVWKFNTDNQLTIRSSDGSTELINLHDTGKLPAYGTRDAVLLVRPDRTFAFFVRLRGEWDLDTNHDLQITIGETVSVIDGFVNDTKSRFIYHFFDKKKVDILGHLGFVGTWDTQVEDGKPLLSFTYKREDGSQDVFKLPEAMTIDRGTNQLVYRYDKNNETFQVTLIGFLRISENFEITYSLDRQTSRGGDELVGRTTFSLQASFVNDKFSSELRLRFTKDDGSGGSELVLSGQMTAALGQTKLQIGFAFSQVKDGEQVTSRALFNGSLEFRNGRVQWSFERSAETTTIAISASDIRLGSAIFDARLDLTAEDGTVVGVQAVFGISF